jgi:hypothetical protein
MKMKTINVVFTFKEYGLISTNKSINNFKRLLCDEGEKVILRFSIPSKNKHRTQFPKVPRESWKDLTSFLIFPYSKYMYIISIRSI